MSADDTTSRPPEKIESDIAETRARIDRTVAQLRDAVSTERMAGAASTAMRDLLAGRSNRLADTIRAHPVPAALVGVGVAWLALAFGRRPGERQARAGGADLPRLLARIATDAAQGGASLRRAASLFADPAVADPLRTGARDFEAVATVLAERVGPMPAGPATEAGWDRIDGLTPAVPVPDALSTIADRLATTLELTRTALRRDLPDGLRVALGAHLHETGATLDRVRSIRDARG